VKRPPAVDFVLTLGALAVASFLAGIAGSYLGIGGGILLVPFMTLVLQLDIKVAVAASLVGVIATSSGAASVYVRDHLTNLRLGMFLEVATSLGAISGAFIALLVDRNALFVVFGAVAIYAAGYMVRARDTARSRAYREGKESPLAERLKLGDAYFDKEDQGVYRYKVARPGAGFLVSTVAGGISGLLGVGGGIIKVPMMHVLMRVPMKPAVATSNFMIGVTAAASAFIYYSRGVLDPALAGVIVLGVFTGTRLGTRMMAKAKAGRVRLAFAALLVAVGVFMILRPLLPGVTF